mgnify:CR=1 FL=1
MCYYISTKGESEKRKGAKNISNENQKKIKKVFKNPLTNRQTYGIIKM